jgi:hypothetical protein
VLGHTQVGRRSAVLLVAIIGARPVRELNRAGRERPAEQVVAEFPQRLQESRRWREDAHVAGDRLDDDAREAFAVLGHGCCHGVDVYRRAMARPIGLSLALGPELVVGARSQVVSSDTERRVLLVLQAERRRLRRNRGGRRRAAIRSRARPALQSQRSILRCG